MLSVFAVLLSSSVSAVLLQRQTNCSESTVKDLYKKFQNQKSEEFSDWVKSTNCPNSLTKIHIMKMYVKGNIISDRSLRKEFNVEYVRWRWESNMLKAIEEKVNGIMNEEELRLHIVRLELKKSLHSKTYSEVLRWFTQICPTRAQYATKSSYQSNGFGEYLEALKTACSGSENIAWQNKYSNSKKKYSKMSKTTGKDENGKRIMKGDDLFEKVEKVLMNAPESKLEQLLKRLNTVEPGIIREPEKIKTLQQGPKMLTA